MGRQHLARKIRRRHILAERKRMLKEGTLVRFENTYKLVKQSSAKKPPVKSKAEVLASRRPLPKPGLVDRVRGFFGRLTNKRG